MRFSLSSSRPSKTFLVPAMAAVMGLLITGCDGDDGDDGNSVPAASNVSASTTKNTAASVTLSGSDSNGDSLTYSIVDAPDNGTASVSGSTLTYTPNSNFLGEDTIEYRVSDGSALSNIATVTVDVEVADGFVLTILHNNDAESQLVAADDSDEGRFFGGAHRFVELAKTLQAEANSQTDGFLMLSSGDNFLAGPEFQASLVESGLTMGPAYLPRNIMHDADIGMATNPDFALLDAIWMDQANYTALCLGNHDFDFGPDILFSLISSMDTTAPFLSSNLDFSAEADLQSLVTSGRIAPSTTVTVDGRRIGIVGATTTSLPNISTPRNVALIDGDGDTVTIEDDNDATVQIQAQVDAMVADGINIIVLISHLQGIDADLAMVASLRNVDVVIAGGGGEILANEGDPLVPGDTASTSNPYPRLVADADGTEIPVVTTTGELNYLGRLVLAFDDDGNRTTIDDELSRPIPVTSLVSFGSDTYAYPVAGDELVQTLVVDIVEDNLEAQASNVIGSSEIALDGVRANVRTTETNLGNLMADAWVYHIQQQDASFDTYDLGSTPVVGLQNGGGIRDSIDAGDITELETFSVAPFSNFVTVVPDMTFEELRALIEHGVSEAPTAAGRFGQWSGLTFTYDPAGTVGSRVTTATLTGGTPLVTGGVTQTPTALVHVATIDFLARGGDGYPFGDNDLFSVGISYQQGLRQFIESLASDTVTSADYPVGGDGRITP